MNDSGESNFLTKKKFGKMIEDTVRDKRLSYMDSIIWLCDENKIDLEDVSKYLSPVIKQQLEYEGQKLNMLPKGNTLPDV
tara:strand:+ start:155 stop:394 length:240 start_codon:yes stop_codon:yes gene_type:complete